MLTHANRTWLAWLANQQDDACVRRALALRLVLAEEQAAAGTPLNMSIAANVSRLLGGNTARCAPTENATAAWLAAGPWCIEADAAGTTWTDAGARFALFFHALGVAGLSPVVSLTFALVLLVWSFLFCVLIVATARAYMRWQHRRRHSKNWALLPIDALNIGGIGSSLNPDMHVDLDEEDAAGAASSANSSAGNDDGDDAPRPAPKPLVPTLSRAVVDDAARSRDTMLGSWTPRGTQRVHSSDSGHV